MENRLLKVNEIRTALRWLVVVGGCALVYHIGKDLGAELYYLIR